VAFVPFKDGKPTGPVRDFLIGWRVSPNPRTTGATLAAISVDTREASERVRVDLDLPFPILCDTERRVIQGWDVYNSRERGGIAKPAVVVIGPDRRVRFTEVDAIAWRAPVSATIGVLKASGALPVVKRKVYIPHVIDWFRAVRNQFRYPARRADTKTRAH